MGPEPGSRTALLELKPGENPEEGNWLNLRPEALRGRALISCSPVKWSADGEAESDFPETLTEFIAQGYPGFRLILVAATPFMHVCLVVFTPGYALLPPGDCPCARVGQNSLYLPPAEPGSRKGKVILVGGADPSGSFADSYVMDLDAHCWTAPAWRGLLPRYEHATFIPTSWPTSLWVFGGASETGNRNCVQVLDLKAGTWMSPKVTGTPPSPRTYHTSSAVIGDRLYVFGGGDKGVDPVKDQQLHIFDSATLTWLQPEVRGDPPAPRHGHAVVAVKNRLYIHGGLAGDTFFDDLFCFDTTEMKWETLSATGSVPAGRAAHSAAVFQGHLYIFGGMDPTGALDTMYKYHIEMGHWTKLEFKTPAPSARLDQSMCVVPWKVSSNEDSNRKEGAGGSNGDNLSQGCPDEHLCLVFGGMDIKGEIYKDSAVTLLK